MAFAEQMKNIRKNRQQLEDERTVLLEQLKTNNMKIVECIQAADKVWKEQHDADPLTDVEDVADPYEGVYVCSRKRSIGKTPKKSRFLQRNEKRKFKELRAQKKSKRSRSQAHNERDYGEIQRNNMDIFIQEQWEDEEMEDMMAYLNEEFDLCLEENIKRRQQEELEYWIDMTQQEIESDMKSAFESKYFYY